ncbi:unnamed protein product, partial [Didymodactylos carnosus]
YPLPDVPTEWNDDESEWDDENEDTSEDLLDEEDQLTTVTNGDLNEEERCLLNMQVNEDEVDLVDDGSMNDS